MPLFAPSFSFAKLHVTLLHFTPHQNMVTHKKEIPNHGTLPTFQPAKYFYQQFVLKTFAIYRLHPTNHATFHINASLAKTKEIVIMSLPRYKSQPSSP